jgi:hypothetical protein
MNRQAYHDERFQIAGLSIGEMRLSVCVFHGWKSLRDGVSSEWKSKCSG